MIEETKELLNEARQLSAVTQSMVVVTHEEYLLAGENFKDIGKKIQLVKEKFKPSKDAAFKAHKEICSLEKSVLDPMMDAESFLKRKIISWEGEQRRIEREAAIKAQREAEEVARRERERKEKERAEQAKKDEEERLKVAEQLKKLGFDEEAKEVEILNEIQSIPEFVEEVPVIVAQPIEKIERVKGVGIRTKHEAEVYDFMALIKAVAEGRQPTKCLMINQKFLNDQANSLKEECRIDGCRIVEVASVARSGR
jgi:hypothetical protein